MALTGVEVREPADRPRAQALADRLGVPLIAAPFGDAGARVIVGAHEVSLGFNDPKRGKPYAVDFSSPDWRRRLHKPLARGHIFRRALGDFATLIDATAGFGGDAVLALNLGVEVIAVERSAAVAALLMDGVARARRDDDALSETFARFRLVEADACAYLGGERADVVYLDPMFTKTNATAKSPKEMQLLQEILPPEPVADEHALFAAAWGAAKKRVVVKRAIKARAIHPAPTHSFKGQSVRYDVYVKV